LNVEFPDLAGTPDMGFPYNQGPMPDLTLLTSNDNPRVKRVVNLREQRERKKEGVFIAEGMREVQRAAEAGLKLREVYFCPKQINRSHEELRGALDTSNAAKWFETTPGVMEKMSYKERPEGVLAVVDLPTWNWDDALPRDNEKIFWIVAVGISKPGNLGAVARSAAAAGAHALLIADGVVDAFNPNAIRASTGAVFSLPVLGASSDEVQTFLKKHQVTPIVASPDAKQRYTDINMNGSIAIVIGAEDTGLDERWMSAGQAVTIPMKGKRVDSLNASIAAGILMFEVVRQREN
jgi:TrmH family RNA methyltransferase